MPLDAQLRDRLAAIVGPTHLREAREEDAIRGVMPSHVLEPGTEDELVRSLALCEGAGLSVIPRGGGTKLGWGNPPRRADVILSTLHLDRIVEHAYSDLTVTVQAGVTIGTLQKALAQHGQRLAVDPLWPERATVGGVLSAQDTGALRVRFGALRDLVLGVSIALPDGTLARSGGKVVKNVAGYDLPKLVTGALGTLGVITQASFRVHPLPAASSTFSFSFPSLEEAHGLLHSVQNSRLAPTGLQARLAKSGPVFVDVRLEGPETCLPGQEQTLRTLAGRDGARSAEVWQAREELWKGAPILAKISVLPTDVARVASLADEIPGPGWRAVIQGTGLGFLRWEAAKGSAVAALRKRVQELGGSLLLLQGSPEGVDAFGDPGDSLPLMRRVKEQFDPKGTLNPGRFVGGI